MENMDLTFQSTACNAHTAANRSRPSCRRRDSASKRRFEDYQEARGSVKRSKSHRFGKSTSDQWVYNFRRHPELPIVISDDESDDEGYQNPGDSAKQNVTEKIEQNRCKAQVIYSDSECDDERPMPAQHRSASHKGKCKIPKRASCAARKVDVSGTKSQRATRVIEEAKAFKSDFPTCMIIMKQSYSNKGSPVHVPSDFARKFLIKAGDNFVTLQDSMGRKWRVGYRFRKVGRRKAELYKGWFQFVLENHLKVGDACVFELVDIDNLEMKVNIFRVCTPCGKRHPASSEEYCQMPSESAEHNDSEDIESDGGRTMPTQTKSATARHGGKHKISKTSEVKVHCSGASERKSQRAMGVIKEARAFKSDYPICTIIVQPSYMCKGSTVVCFATTPNCLTLNFYNFLLVIIHNFYVQHVPIKFARDILPMAGDKFVTLKDSTGKKWRVGYSTNPSASKVSLYNGWHEFVLENHLMVGDACVFELVGIDNLEMKVNIIRAFPDIV
ncbi:hypothetical protein MKW98_022372 [Papaver atlanticum]|uniref:TF-B3 domain-containing protein n=1 Tax=Papaver atlanticum TaxID=357466 RepID=A0AAD4SMY6_9MAGN|nr:hypothetical protein MKW98_022372 [Papaver atlanticum]